MKFKVECGSLVTRFMGRKYIIHAKDEAEAREKAEERFRDDCKNLKTWTECGDTVNIDYISEME